MWYRGRKATADCRLNIQSLNSIEFDLGRVVNRHDGHIDVRESMREPGVLCAIDVECASPGNPKSSGTILRWQTKYE